MQTNGLDYPCNGAFEAFPALSKRGSGPLRVVGSEIGLDVGLCNGSVIGRRVIYTYFKRVA